jgi:Ni,Fe-hydrogenase III small subunit
MQHITDHVWVDYVRGTLAPDAADAVDRHLKSGCARCFHARDLWLSVRRRADRERLYDPPGDALAFAVAQFRAFRAERRLTPMRAMLLFDSLHGANPVGVRGAVAPLLRHLLYQAGSFSIDFSIEPRADSTELALTGQVADAKRVAVRETRSRAPRPKVLLLQGDRELAATATNRVGEFEFKFEPQEDLALMVLVKGRPPVLVELREVLGRRGDA